MNVIELDSALRGRRSIRKYLSVDIPDSLVLELIDLARHAPSSMNGQPSSFIVLRDQKLKSRLAEIKDALCAPSKQHYKATMLRTAPVVIVICVDRQRANERVLENGVLAASQLMLAAHGRGLGTVFMTAYREDEPRVQEQIRDLLKIPETVDPVVLLPLGYPDELPAEKVLKTIEGVVHRDTYN